MRRCRIAKVSETLYGRLGTVRSHRWPPPVPLFTNFIF